MVVCFLGNINSVNVDAAIICCYKLVLPRLSSRKWHIQIFVNSVMSSTGLHVISCCNVILMLYVQYDTRGFVIVVGSYQYDANGV